VPGGAHHNSYDEAGRLLGEYDNTAKPRCPGCDFYTAMLGVKLRCGALQSIPSSSIASCAALKCTAPSHALGPHEAAALQAFGIQVHPIATPPQQLDQITALATEHEHMAAL
jgi:hypothetical protein